MTVGPRGVVVPPPAARATGRRTFVAALVALVVALPGLLGPNPGPAAAAPARPMAPTADRVICRFDTGELGEVSGIALSRQHDGILWATNDSGNGPYLYALDVDDCRIRATLRLLDTPARDHEALAVGTDAAGRDVIWVADIGDNIGGWSYARIHKVVEPARIRDRDVPVTTYRFTYPSGSVDAEALLAAPDREALWVITKEPSGGGVYALPTPMSDSLTPMRATRVGDARSTVTDAAMSPDGERYVVRDYLSAEVFTGEPPGEAQARFGLPIQPQGEAITWTADGRGVLIVSERSPELVEVDLPRSALGEEGGLAAVLPRVAGFDIYPYVRLALLVLAAVGVLAVLRRVARRRRPRRG